jgi:hypothetical protein
MNPRRSARVDAERVLSPGLRVSARPASRTPAAPILDRPAPILIADVELTDAPRLTAMGNTVIGTLDVARAMSRNR